MGLGAMHAVLLSPWVPPLRLEWLGDMHAVLLTPWVPLGSSLGDIWCPSATLSLLPWVPLVALMIVALRDSPCPRNFRSLGSLSGGRLFRRSRFASHAVCCCCWTVRFANASGLCLVSSENFTPHPRSNMFVVGDAFQKSILGVPSGALRFFELLSL